MGARRRTTQLRALLLAVGGAAAAALAVSVAAGIAGGDSAPMNTALPTISGTAKDGSTLTADQGTWSGTPPIDYTYRWQRCNSSGGGCADISGASNVNYTLTPADVDSTIRVSVTAMNSAGSSVAASGATATVAPAGTAPANTKKPSISGTLREGQTLTAAKGDWSGSTPISYAHQWQRCDDAGNNCTAVGGATQTTYKLVAADVGRRMRVDVRASNTQGTTTATSDPTGVVSSLGGAPAAKKAPAISGRSVEGQTLSAGAGDWDGARPFAFAYQWLRCDQAGNACAPIGGATQGSYRLVAADVGRRLRVQVKASNVEGSATAASGSTGVVAPAGGGAVPISAVSLPNRLVIARISFQPNPVRSRSPFSATVTIRDVGNRPVSGALVFIRGVPERRISPEAEVRTDDRGIASFTLDPTRLLPLRRGARLTVFVRARKEGERLVAGVTASRLASLRLGPPQ
jgi:hypothetical protein